jgi:transposase InsO family protein
LLRRRERLRLPQKASRRRRRGTSTIDSHPAGYSNHVWSYDFVADQTTDGKTIRFLTVIDEYTRRGLWIECARHLASVDVVRALEQLVEIHVEATTIKSDNAPAFVAKKVQDWIDERHIGARFIEPGSLWQNGHSESFNAVPRRLLEPAALRVRSSREAPEAWLHEYNKERPPRFARRLTPFSFFERGETQNREAV